MRLPALVCLVPTLVLLALAGSAARADDADAVKERLFQAKKGYDAEAQKFRQAVGDLLDKREEAARKAGSKKQLDQVKAERTAFEKEGELPTAVPAPTKQQLGAARAKLEKAYATAVKDYVKLKEDAAAAAVEKEQQKFAIASALQLGKRTYLVTLKHFDVKAKDGMFTNDGTLASKKSVNYKFNGEPAPHSISIFAPPKGTAQVKYPLDGKWLAVRATVGVPKVEDSTQEPASALVFEVLGDGKSLWKSEPVKKRDEFQTCVVSVEKVKVLTLQVHCAGKPEWCRAVWFEPTLVE